MHIYHKKCYDYYNFLVYRVTYKISDTFQTTAGNDYKSIFNFVLGFCSILLNFSVLCDAYAVYRQYARLFQNNEI